MPWEFLHHAKLIPSAPPVGSCSCSGSGVVVEVSTTGSSLLLLWSRFPAKATNRRACHPASSMDGNSMIPWPPLPLEPGIYGGGVARVGELVSSYSFGTNKSLDAGFFSYGSSLMLPNIQEPRTNDHPVRSHFYQSWAYNDTGVFFRRVHDNHSSRRESFRSRSNRRIRRHKRPHRVIFRGHRKLLRVHGSSTTKQAPLRHRRRRVLLVVDRTAATTRIAVGLALFGLLCTVAGLVLWCLRKNSKMRRRPSSSRLNSAPRRGLDATATVS